jgi:hypothetical protein
MKKQKVPNRQKTHGDYSEQSSVFCNLIVAMRGTYHLTDNQAHAVLMILNKLSRIATGDPGYLDHWVDIAGYCQRVIDGK